MLRVHVITVSDRAANGTYADLSGPRICELLKQKFADIRISSRIVPDDTAELAAALADGLGHDWILTAGGTGLGPRDITPETTAAFCDTEIPGIAEILRTESYKETDRAMLSRGYAGLKEKTIIVNIPGSVKAVECCLRILLPIMEHATAMINGEGH